MQNKFIAWFELDSPNFMRSYGDVRGFYDADNDVFLIEEIQTAYEDFKKGDEPSSLYYNWGACWIN